MPTPVQLDLALAGIALARNWLVGDRETVERIEAEVRRLACATSSPSRRSTATTSRPGNDSAQPSNTHGPLPAP